MFFMTDFSLFKSVISAKKSAELFKERGYKTAVLADTNLSATLTFYYAAKGAGIKPVISVQAVFEGALYLFIAHNSKGFSILTRSESYGYEKSIFENENITAIVLDILEPKAEIHSKYGSLKNELVLVDSAINKKIAEKTTLLPIKIANGSSEIDFFTIGSMSAVENKTTYEEEIANQKIYLNTIQDKNELTNSQELIEIISKCVDDYTFGNPTPPTFKFVKEVGAEYGLENATDQELFEKLSWIGLAKRFNGEENIPENYKERLSFELSVISGMKFPGYFLIVWDFINYAKSQKIPVGPGRGSAAGSLAAYCLFITNLDPIPYNLLFERFLNPERISLPDVDLDFCQDRREEVIKYVQDKYGAEFVAQVITFGKLAAKASIKDAARIVGAPLYLGEKLSKLVADKPGTTLASTEKDSEGALKEMFEEDYIAKKVWEKAKHMENLKKNRGVHAAGLVISNTHIADRAPLYNVKGVQVVGFEGGYLEDVNLVKYDFLGLKTLTVIDNTIKSVEKNTNHLIDLESLDLSDKKVYDYISKGSTVGMFQIESDGMQDLAKRLRPSNFEEVIAMLALYRPGPMEAGMLDSFINRKHGREEVDYFFKAMEPALKPILEPTYGLIVYQEQVMQIVQVIAGFSLGEADLVRRAMGKKKVEEMEKISKEFAERAVEKGYKKEEAIALFHLIEKFAGYGFNKSHSAAYALVTFYTAFLKFYHPVEFMANLINSEITNTDKIVPYISECKNLGISITKPDLFNSDILFTPYSDKKEIVFGLKAVKGVGSGAESILSSAKVIKEKKGSIQDLFILTQRNISKEIETQVKEINKIERKITSAEKKYAEAFAKVNELNAKLSNGILLNKREETTFNNKTEIVQEQSNIIENLSNEKVLIELSIRELELELSNDTAEKLDKRVVEALAEVGAFDCFGITRKDMLENISNFLTMKFDEITFTNSDFDLSDKILLEEKRTGLIISSLYSTEEAALIDSLEIPVDMPIGVIIGKEVRSKKNGGNYTQVKFLLPNETILEATDFNNISEKFEIGSLVSTFIRINGNYKNVQRIAKLTEKVIGEYPRKKIVKKITVFEDINQEELSPAQEVEVYDLDGNLIAVLNKRVA